MTFRIQTDPHLLRVLGTDGAAWASAFQKQRRHTLDLDAEHVELTAWFNAAIGAGSSIEPAPITRFQAYASHRGVATKLAQAVGVHVSTITRIAKGETDPPASTIQRICDASEGELSPGDFFAAQGGGDR